MGIANGKLPAIALSLLIGALSTSVAQEIRFAGAGASATGDLLAFFSSSGSNELTVSDVSYAVQQKIAAGNLEAGVIEDPLDLDLAQGAGRTGPVIWWTTIDRQTTVQRVASVSPAGDLLIFYWSTQAASTEEWHLVNVSGIIQQKVAGPLAQWQTSDGPYTVDHIASVSPAGDLLIFYWSNEAASPEDWHVVNVSGITQQKVAGYFTSWQAREGTFNVEHLVAATPDGDLVDFYWTPASDWQVVNLSGGTQQKTAGPLTSWQTSSVGGLLKTQHVAASTQGGDLLVFYRNPLADELFGSPAPRWHLISVSEKTGLRIAGIANSWVTRGVELIGAIAPDNDFYVFWSVDLDRDVRWGFCDISNHACS